MQTILMDQEVKRVELTILCNNAKVVNYALVYVRMRKGCKT